MNAQPTRRAILSAVAVAPLAGVTNSATALALPDAAPDLSALAAQLQTAATTRRLAWQAARSARKAIARWGVLNPRPDFAGDGADLFGWLDRYRAAIVNTGAIEKQALHEAACAAHAGLAAVAVATARRTTLADLRALASLLPFDCDGIIRAAVLAGVQGGAVLA